MAITVAMRTQVSQLYVSLFGRAPDGEGLGFWVNQLDNGQTMAQVAQSMFNVTAARAYYPAFATNEEIVATFYQNVLGRAVGNDTEGQAFWAKKMNDGATKGSVISEMLFTVANYTGTDAAGVTSKALFNNKVNVAQFYGEQNGSIAGATTALASVTSDVATVATAKTAASAAAAASTGQTFTLTTSSDITGNLQADVTKSTTNGGNDSFMASVGIAASTFSIGDTLDGGAGADSLTLNDAVATPAAYTLAMPVGASVKSIETLSVNGSLAVTANTTAAGWADAGITRLNVTGADDISIVAAATTDVVAVASALSAAAGTELGVEGGKNVTTTSADSVTGDTGGAGAVASSTIVIGGTTAPTGAVSVTHTETTVDNATAGASTSTTSTINVTGGTTVAISSLVTAGVAENAGDISTIGAIGVAGKATTTSVSVTQSAATAVFAAAGDKIQILNGAVTIADVNAADGTKAGSIASVTLTNFGNSTVDSSALTSVTLGGTGGTMGIGRGALTAVPTANTLALNTNTLTGTNTITDSEAAADDGFTTINLTNTGTTVIADLVAADLTTLNIAGSGSLKLTANTLGGSLTTTIVNTSTGTVELAGALTAAATYTGSAAVDKVTAGAGATGTINTGAGDDTITASTLGTAGRINGGDGTADTLLMTAANAATATASAAFAAKVTNVERLALSAYADAAGVTVNLANMNNYNHVTSAGATASTGGARAQAISGFTTGGTFNQTALLGTSQNVTLSGAAFSAGLTDSFNLGMTGTNGYANAGVLTLADIETLAITTTDSDTTAATTAFDANIDSTSVKTVTVTGNAGMTFANSDLGTALTSFNASGVTVGPITYTTAALAAAATITGGAGDDTLNAAAAAVAGVTTSGGAGNDTITGSATKANTLNGDAGNDSITGGSAADVIDGGAGTNTYVFSSANVAEQAGSGTTSGAVINLSADALTATAVNTATGLFLTSLQASVATGSSTYLFSNESNTNATVIDTLANINNATGTDLADYIVGSATANTITGGAGGDVLAGGAGIDTFVAATRAESLVAADAAGLTYDQISDFLSGTDKLDLAGALTLTAAVDGATNFNANTQAWDTNFNTTVAAAVTALGANAFANVGDVIALTITGGTAAQNGVWVLQNTVTAAFAIADDLAIKLIGTSSTTLALTDFQ